MKLTGDGELNRMLLVAQCNALNAAMPFLFERIDDETELLLPGMGLPFRICSCGLAKHFDNRWVRVLQAVELNGVPV